MKLKERNYAGDHLVVGSLNVLGDIKGGNIAEIRRNIDLIQKQTEFMGRKQNEYWEELSSDGVITPLEKQQLLKEMRSITQSQAAIVLQARSVGMEGSQFVQDYLAVYNDLYSYLYTTLKIFDDMEMNTDIPDRAAFNSYFTSYYYDESFVYIALSKGLLNSLSITVLSSLTDPGTEGEMGLYRGNLYQYVDGAWKHVATGDYKGALTSLPAAIEDSFFLAADDFILTVPFYVNDEPFYVNSYEFGINRFFRKGYIYYCKNGGWREEPDKTNYRYVAAFADVLNITGELPQIFQDALDELQEQIDDISLPSYRGPSNVDPSNPTEGDFYVYSGLTTMVRRNSDIYKYENGDWRHLDPLESQNSTYYMQALEDILALNNADNGYFAALFANILISNKAFMDALTTRIITLQQGQPGQPGGYIQSDNYDPDSPESDGFRVDYNGDADFNGDTHIAGKVAIGVPLRNNSDFNDYDVVIGGNTKISGNLDGASGTFSGICSAKGLNIVGFDVGDYELLTLKYIDEGLTPIQGTAYKVVGTGTFRCNLKCRNSNTTPATYKVFKNDELVYSVTFPSDYEWHYDTFDLSVSFGDIIKIYGEGAHFRVPSMHFYCTLCMDAPNQIMSLLSTPYSY